MIDIDQLIADLKNSQASFKNRKVTYIRLGMAVKCLEELKKFYPLVAFDNRKKLISGDGKIVYQKGVDTVPLFSQFTEYDSKPDEAEKVTLNTFLCAVLNGTLSVYEEPLKDGFYMCEWRNPNSGEIHQRPLYRQGNSWRLYEGHHNIYDEVEVLHKVEFIDE